MNIVKGEPYRKKLKPGDFFAMELCVGGFVIGRFIKTLRNGVPFLDGSYLIYIFDRVRDQPVTDERDTKENLLVSPDLVNRLGWSRGYFRHIEHRPIKRGEVFKNHCHHCYIRELTNTGYIDDRGKPCRPFEPILSGGLGNYRTVDMEISEVLGLDPEQAGL